ncbi:MAG: transposase [Phycisphaerae bacterium]|jgi:transposase
MALGRRKRERQAELWVPTADVPAAPGHPFYEQLNRLLGEVEFDEYVEDLCRPHYAEKQGRPSIPPGVYFRMLFVGYFEGLDSQRGIAWRCADSLALKAFLGYMLTEATPEHSSLTRVRQRLPEAVHEQVFAFVLAIAREKKLLRGQTTGVDATLLEANAAMKSIVRRDTGEDYKDYLRRLAQEAGIDDSSDDDLKKFDKKRKKKMSNEEWVSPNDPSARIMKMKDGRTHLAYKAEHAVDLESGLLLAATIHHGDRADGDSLADTLIAAQVNLMRAGSEVEIKNVPVDNGYHANAALAQCQEWGLRTYAAEKDEPYRRKWTDKPAEYRRAYHANRRRVRGRRGKRLQKLRSEYCERSFAHMCETGAARRSWLQGLVDVGKRYLMHAAGHNLGVVMRTLFGVGTPRSLQGEGASAPALGFAVWSKLVAVLTARSACYWPGPASAVFANARPRLTAA